MENSANLKHISIWIKSACLYTPILPLQYRVHFRRYPLNVRLLRNRCATTTFLSIFSPDLTSHSTAQIESCLNLYLEARTMRLRAVL